MDKQYYIDKYNKLYDECLIEAGEENADDVTAGADTLFEEYASAEHIVGYYLCNYEDSALSAWKNNLSYAIERWKNETDTDKEVTAILTGLFPELSSEKEHQIRLKAVGIEWDVTDGAEDMTQEEINEILETLPTEIEIPNGMTDEDEISDYISNETGFCHYGFHLISVDVSELNKKASLSEKIQDAENRLCSQEETPETKEKEVDTNR